MNSRAGRVVDKEPRMNVPSQSFIPRAEQELVYRLINDLVNPDLRKNALLELCKRRESIPDLGPMLYHSFGTLSILLQEVISVYSLINPPALTTAQSNTACNALALLQCIASHPETRHAFLSANIHRFIYPFLEIVPKSRPLEYLKLTSLGVIGALVKTDEQEVVNFLLSSEIIPYCLRNMEVGSDLSKTVATYILQRILAYENGLNYVCQTYERFSHVAMILGKMVIYLASAQPSNLVRHVIRIYLRLSENPRAREALRQCLPDQMRDNSLVKYLKEGDAARNWLAQLHQNLKNVSAAPPVPVPIQMSLPMPVPDEHMPYIMH